MKTRKLANIEIFEISFIFSPNKPAVQGAIALLVKSGVPFLERPEVLQALRDLDKVVEGMKAQQLAKEQEAAVARQRAKTPKRIVRRDFDSFEEQERIARARTRQAEFYRQCLESSRPVVDPITGREFRRFQSDYGR